MKSGCIELSKLYSYVNNDLYGLSLNGNGKDGRAFGRLAKSIVSSIDTHRGFYLWGKYESTGLWRNIYLGKAELEKEKTANLRSRILEELKDERAFLWHNFLKKDFLFSLGEKYYPKMWSTYKVHWERTIQKTGTTHIIWVTTPELKNENIKMIESDLIEAINPIANFQRPSPKPDFQECTIEVISKFKENIHKNRKEAFKL